MSPTAEIGSLKRGFDVNVCSVCARWAFRPGAPTVSWRTEPVVRAAARETVAATGSLDAALAVEVGTQISGAIESLGADDNDRVSAGQIIALIDPSILEADVAPARATLAVREAELGQARLSDRRQAAFSGGAPGPPRPAKGPPPRSPWPRPRSRSPS